MMCWVNGILIIPEILFLTFLDVFVKRYLIRCEETRSAWRVMRQRKRQSTVQPILKRARLTKTPLLTVNPSQTCVAFCFVQFSIT